MYRWADGPLSQHKYTRSRTDGDQGSHGVEASSGEGSASPLAPMLSRLGTYKIDIFSIES